jgi:hypothetical protein
MKTRRAVTFLFALVVLAAQALAGGKADLQRFFSDASQKVKATASPSEKRLILSESFQTMSTALDMAQRSPFISKDEYAGLDVYKSALQSKQDELAGRNGYIRVSDERLNAFSEFVVQDMEQADQVVTISVVTLLLILILVILLVR